MSGVGFFELVILFMIGLVVLGPQRLPKVANQLGTSPEKTGVVVTDVDDGSDAANNKLGRGMIISSVNSSTMWEALPTPLYSATRAVVPMMMSVTAGLHPQ